MSNPTTPTYSNQVDIPDEIQTTISRLQQETVAAFRRHQIVTQINEFPEFAEINQDDDLHWADDNDFVDSDSDEVDDSYARFLINAHAAEIYQLAASQLELSLVLQSLESDFSVVLAEFDDPLSSYLSPTHHFYPFGSTSVLDDVIIPILSSSELENNNNNHDWSVAIAASLCALDAAFICADMAPLRAVINGDTLDALVQTTAKCLPPAVISDIRQVLLLDSTPANTDNNNTQASSGVAFQACQILSVLGWNVTWKILGAILDTMSWWDYVLYGMSAAESLAATFGLSGDGQTPAAPTPTPITLFTAALALVWFSLDVHDFCNTCQK